MRLLAITALLSISSGLGFGQKTPPMSEQPSDQIKLLADHEVKDGATLKLRGHVQVMTSSIIVYADEADYSSITGELDARGHVHMDLRNARPRITIQNSTPEDIPLWSPK